MKRHLLAVMLCLFTTSVFAQVDMYSPGKLIIIGGGEIPDTIYHLFAQACGGKDQPIVVIPTATGDDEWIRTEGHLKRFREKGFSNLLTVHTRDKAKADDPTFLAAIAKAKGIYFGGGDQDRLAKAYQGTKLHQAMYALLKRGGVIMGTSAGATIMGSVLIGGDHRSKPNQKHTFPEGLSFVGKTAIDQHVLARNRQFDLLPVMEADSTIFGMAIDESTAAVMENGSISAAGKSYVLLYDRTDWARQQQQWGKVFMPFKMIRPGDKYDLTKREIIRR